MKLKNFIWGLFLTSRVLYADLIDPDIQVATDGDPLATVSESVNLLTGDFVAFAEDYVVPGAVPIHLRRHYVSGNGKGNYGGWEFFPHLRLEVIIEEGKRVHWKHAKRIRVADSTGSRLIFKWENKGNPDDEHIRYTVDFEKHGKGITNTSRGAISGQTNLKNHLLIRERSNLIVLYCADGTQRYYRLANISEKNPTSFRLTREILPNGHEIHYKYDKKDRLQRIHSPVLDQDNEYYAWCEFHYEGDNIKILTSDGKKLKYDFSRVTGKKKEQQLFLKKVKSPSNPLEEQIYVAPEQKDMRNRLKRRFFPCGQSLHVEYYETENWLRFRVQTLYRTLDAGGIPVPTHTFYYDPENRTNTVYDGAGNKTLVNYTADYLISSIIYCEGEVPHHQILHEWGEYGQLEEKVFADGEGNPLVTRKYTYDDRGNPIEVAVTGTICVEGTNHTQVETYAYDEKNRQIRSTTPEGLNIETAYLPGTNLVAKKHTTDAQGLHLREFYSYNKDRFLIEKIIDDGSGADAVSLSDVTERHIERIALKRGLPEEITKFALNLNTGTEELLGRTKLHYNLQCQVFKKEYFDADGILCKTETYDYDETGKLIHYAGPEGQFKTCEYDRLGNPILETTSGNKQIRRLYDCAGRPYSETELGGESQRTTRRVYDNHSNVIQATDTFQNTTYHRYDAFKRCMETEHPNGSVEKTSYDPLGYVTSSTDPCGNTTYMSHNIHGKPLEIRHPDGSQETFTYYPNGQLKAHTNQVGVITEHLYDALGRETAIHTINQDGAIIAIETFNYSAFHLTSSRDKEGVMTYYSYDFAGRKTRERRANKTATFEYDRQGRIEKTTHCDMLTTQRTYNALDQLITEELQDRATGESLQTTHYRYDENGNQREIIYSKGTETLEYDPFNRLLSHTDLEGNRTHITYDESHQNSEGKKVLKKTTKDPHGTKTVEIYDTMMRLVRKEIWTREHQLIFAEDYIRDPSGQTTLQKCHVYEEGTYTKTLLIEKSYDAMHRLESVLEGAHTPERKYTAFTYTLTGHLATVTKPDETVLTYTYDALDRHTRLHSSDGTIDYSYTYTLNGHLLTSHDNIRDLTTTRTIDPNGNILTETLANGLTVENSYDPLDRRVDLRHAGAQVRYTYGPLQLTRVEALGQTATYTYDEHHQLIGLDTGISVTYAHDRLGRRTQLISPSYCQALTFDELGNITEYEDDDDMYDLRYDALSQLIEEKDHTYAYDSYHNRLFKDDTPYTVNTLHAITEAGENSYTYDANGNPVSKSTPLGTYYYEYDALDRLIAVRVHDQATTYTYDSEHRRVSKTHNGQTTHYLYDGQDEIGACTAAHQFLELRILGDRSYAERETLYIYLHGQLYLPITDLQGNIIRLHAADGTEVHAYRYNAFGEEHSHPNINPWRYASKRCDPETGLIYFGRRYYDPEVGRFHTPDPSPLTDSLNLYAYTLNNPLRHHDLYGLSISHPPPIDPHSMFYNTIEESAMQPQVTFVPYRPKDPLSFTPVQNLGLQNGVSLEIPSYEPSMIYDLGLSKEMPDRRVMYVNGIMNSSQDALVSAHYIASLAQEHNVHGVYSASFGLALDVNHTQALLRYEWTRTVAMIHQSLDEYFANASPAATILIIAHSRGAAAVRNALFMYDKEKRSRVFVIAVAPAAYIDLDTCGGVRHYTSDKDVVHLLDTYGRRKYAHTVYPLRSKVGPKIDHTILSPTFEDPLVENISYYLKNGHIRKGR